MSKPEPEEEEKKKERMDKKRKLKEMFDAEYDEGDATYFDDLKEEMHKQAQVQAVNLAMYLAVCLKKYSIEFAQRFFPGDSSENIHQKIHACNFFMVELFASITGKKSKQTKD